MTCVEYVSVDLALLQSSGVRVLGTFTHAEVDADVQSIGATCCNERSSKPVVDRRDGHVTHCVNSYYGTSRPRVTRLTPLSSDTRCLYHY